MKPLNNKDRLEELMKKYLAKEHSSADAEELFDLLRSIHQPEGLEAFFEDRWALEDRAEAKVVWEDVLRAREEKSLQYSKRKARSEERRVGKEGRGRGDQRREKKNRA